MVAGVFVVAPIIRSAENRRLTTGSFLTAP
jgi:hypothetical protein